MPQRNFAYGWGNCGGRSLSLNVSLHPQAQALITTAAAAKVYRSNGLEAKQSTHLQVAAGACLEWLPQETIIFDGANYRQNLRVDLAEDSLWLGWEITRLGRSARGEKFASGEWRSHTEVWQNGKLLWVDPQWLQGGSEMLTSSNGLAGCPVVASFALVGRSPSDEVIDKARQFWEEKSGDESDRPTNAGVTRLMSGTLCRYRGYSSLEARRWLMKVWHLMRLTYLSRPGCNPRVWPP